MIAIVMALLALPAAAQNMGQGFGEGHVKFALQPGTAGVQPGATTWVALRQTIAPGWHTYWRNAGDAGEATALTWALPSGWSAGDIVWPRPRRLREAGLMTYGYEDRVLLLVPLQVPAGARPGSTASVSARVDVLVCKDLCIPESAQVRLDLPVVSGPPDRDPGFGAEIARALAASPRPDPAIHAGAELHGEALRLAVAGGPLKGADAAGAYFFPFQRNTILYAARQAVERGPDGLTLTLTPSPGLAKSGLIEPVRGVLETRAGAWEISAGPGAPPAGASGLGPAPAADEKPAPGGPGLGGLASALAFGLMGGLVLNLMPCVFPVLSMKAASMARGAHDPVEVRRDGLFFLGGVIVSFLALAAAVIAARAAGQAVGWGFQLQSPAVTAFLSLLVLAIALNLSGVFEAGLSLQRLGTGLQSRPGGAGAFFTGVLAVVVGAPCTAPLMASAIGYALTAPAAQTLAVFLALALGMAAPYVGLSFSPALLRRVPRPGPWMDALRRLLAFPMYGTAAFMAWVFAQQTGSAALGFLFAAAVALSTCLHLWGQVQRTAPAGRRALAPLAAAGVCFAVAVFLAIWGVAGKAAPANAQAAIGGGPPGGEPWSADKAAAAHAEGRPVFVNFTAAWCLTCKVNEAVAFSDPAVAQAFRRTRTLYLVADWTRRDPAIAAALAEHGRAGVPMYLAWRPQAPAPDVLPQFLNGAMVVRAVGG